MPGQETTPKLHVRALLRPNGFERCTNPGFETNTTGWSVSAGINVAGTSITRITTDDHSGSASARLVTAATAGSGVNFDLGSERYWQESAYGTVYAALVWLKRESGPTRARIVLGSEGTSADRATYVITDLADEWTPYRVLWYPSSSRTDVQLAIVTDVAAALTVLIDDVSIYQVDAFSQVENANFITDTTGWATGASLNAAGTSITRRTDGGMTGTTYARVVTTATDNSGVNFLVRSREFVSGRTYRVRAALRRNTGNTTARLRLGSFGTGASRSSATPFTITDSWAWYYADVTMSATCTDMEVIVTTGAASALTVDVGAVEVYEASDELNGDAGRVDVSSLRWTRPTSAMGTATLTLHDPQQTPRYTPWYTSGALYGLIDSGRRVWCRAVFGTTISPVWFGTIRRWIPDPDIAVTTVMAEDPFLGIGDELVTIRFADDRTYRDARAALFGAGALAAGREPVAGDARTDLTTSHTEQQTFYDGTNGEVSALDYLNNLNDANGTVHHIAPDARSEYLWRYTTVERTDLTDAAASSTALSADDFASLTGLDLSDETVETSQAVTWQAYERLVEAGTLLAQARDPGGYDDTDGDDPYLHFVRDDIGTDEDVPEPTYEREVVWRRKRVRKSKKKVRVKTIRFRRVYPDAFVPFDLTATTEKTWALTFSVPVVVDGVTTAHPSATPATVDDTTVSPREVAFRAYAAGASTTGSVQVTGAAWLPLDEQTYALINHERVLSRQRKPGPTSNTPYIPDRASAEGMARFRDWRYGEPRLRPTLTHEHTQWATMLPLGPTSKVAVTAPKQQLSSAPFVVTALEGDVSGNGLRWSLKYALEALPASIGTLFTLDSSTMDDGHVLGY